jgi:hypothetical protein
MPRGVDIHLFVSVDEGLHKHGEDKDKGAEQSCRVLLY